MTISDIMNFAAPAAAFFVGMFGGARFVNGNKGKIEQLEAGLQAVKAGADGTLKLLGEVVAASNDNTLTADEFNQIVAAAADIPTAVRLALKMTSTKPAIPAAA